MPASPIAGAPQPLLFTLSPRHLGGRRALKGFKFQTAYITYVLAGFAAGKEDFLSGRVEGVEDLDTLLRVDDKWVERYYQIKSRIEGDGRWTLNLLERDGILSRFYDLFRDFRALNTNPNRRIEFVIAVDGELDNELVQLRDVGVAATESAGKLFGILCAHEVAAQDRSLEPLRNAIRDWCQAESREVIAGSTRLALPEHRERELRVAAQHAGASFTLAIDLAFRASAEIASVLADFLPTVTLESRLGSLLDDATFGRLVESGDLSPEEAKIASDRLRHSIEDESTRPVPEIIDHSVLRNWLGVPSRVRLQHKPTPEADAVQRDELLAEVSGVLRNHGFLSIHGISKIGKSQFAAALIDYDHRANTYFWYTCLGEGGDLNRLTNQLAVWVGERLGRWQIMDDLRAGLQPEQAFERFGRCPITGCYVVIDDCHKMTDGVAPRLLHELTSQHWKESRLILLGEHKIPAAAALGAREISLTGLTPRESLLFMAKLGVNLRNCIVESATLSLQVGGHPVMLRAMAKELPRTPVPADLLALAQRIPSIQSAQAFLDDLSNRIFFDLLRTPDQRTWLARIGSVGFPVTQQMALFLAQAKPTLQILTIDWNYLRSLLLDEVSPDHYSVPVLLRQIAGASISSEEKKALQVKAARHVFRTAAASRSVDLWDFQHAIFAMLGAECYDEAAMRFVHSFPSLISFRSFEHLELLFLAMNSELVHSKISDPGARWLMLQFEIHLRVQDDTAPDREKLFGLVRRMHRLLRASEGAVPVYGPSMLHLAVLSIRMRYQQASNVLTKRMRVALSAPLHSALRAALVLRDIGLISNLLHFYDHLYPLLLRPDIELFKDALSQLPTDGPMPISAHALVAVYSSYVGTEHHSADALKVVQAHGELFKAKAQNEAYFACEHAAAVILHDGRSSFAPARERLMPLLSKASELHLSSESVSHGLSFVADTYFAEKDYANSADYYSRVLGADLGSDGLHHIVCVRLCDALIFLGRHADAVRVALGELRANRRQQTTDQKCQLYARLAYAFAENRELRKAAISSQGLSRLAFLSGSETLGLLATTVAGWVLGHFEYSDRGIPESDTKHIRDSSALSETIPEDQLARWRDADPFKTRCLVMTATLFELLEDFRRSAYLYQRAAQIVLGADQSVRLHLETAYVYLLRLARVHIRVGRLEDAARGIRDATSCAVSARKRGEPDLRGSGSIYALLMMVDNPLRACEDDDLMTFFDLLSSEYDGQSGYQGWIRFRESELLFDRLNVQAAKRRLALAMEFARDHSESDLVWQIAYQKLVTRRQQVYSLQEDWLRDALDIVLELATEDSHIQHRRPFADAVYSVVATAGQGPFALVRSAMGRLRSNWPEQAFWVTAYGLWRAATDVRILAASRVGLESLLKSEAPFLQRSEFD